MSLLKGSQAQRLQCLTQIKSPDSIGRQDNIKMVLRARLELARLTALDPKSSAATNYATSAKTALPQNLATHLKHNTLPRFGQRSLIYEDIS